MHFFTASLTDQGQFVAPVIHLILPCADLPKIAQCPTKTRRRRRIGSCSTATTTPPLLLSLKYETWSITAKSSPPGLLVSLRRRCSTLPAHFGHFRPKPDLTLWPDASGSFQRRNHSLHQSTLFIPSTGLVLSKLLHEDSRITTFLFCELLLNDPRSSDQDAHIGPTLKTRSLLSPQPAPSGMFWFFSPPLCPQRNTLIFPKHGDFFDDQPSCSADIWITFAVFFTHKSRSGAAGRRGGDELLSGRFWPLFRAWQVRENSGTVRSYD